MIGFESESKFQILKNARSFQDDVIANMESLGYKLGIPRIIDQVDVYFDSQMKLFKSGFSLRHRYRSGRLYKITLKTLEHLDDKNHLRIEEEATTLPQLVKMVSFKLRSIFQGPEDEIVASLLEKPEELSPVVILTNHRESYEIGCNSRKCEISFDTVSYLFPKTSTPINELEIEGPAEFDNIRDLILKKYGSGRWHTIGLSTLSKFENGLKLGGAI